MFTLLNVRIARHKQNTAARNSHLTVRRGYHSMRSCWLERFLTHQRERRTVSLMSGMAIESITWCSLHDEQPRQMLFGPRSAERSPRSKFMAPRATIGLEGARPLPLHRRRHRTCARTIKLSHRAMVDDDTSISLRGATTKREVESHELHYPSPRQHMRCDLRNVLRV